MDERHLDSSVWDSIILTEGVAESMNVDRETLQGSSAPPRDLSPTRAHDLALSATKKPTMKKRRLEWNRHKRELHKLYLKGPDTKTVDEIRDYMSTEYGFDASPKQYKHQFKLWGWRKSLPVKIAKFMVHKANERRRRPHSKDTVFLYGGQEWTRERALVSVSRSQKEVATELNMATPPEIIKYGTPKESPAVVDLTTTPQASEEDVSVASWPISSSDEIDSDADADTDSNELRLNWNGRTLTEVNAMFESAKAVARGGNPGSAEKMFSAAVEGYRKLLSATHKTTVKATFTLATFHVERDSAIKAYRLLELSCRHHVEKFGLVHKRTVQHILNVIEFLNGCGRKDDALALWSRAEDMLDSHTTHKGRNRRVVGQARRHPQDHAQSEESSDLVNAQLGIASGEFEYGLGVARTYTRNKNVAAEDLLLAIILQCGEDTDKLAVHRLEAWTELLTLYRTLGVVHQRLDRLKEAKAAFDAVMLLYPWGFGHHEKVRAFDVLEAQLMLSSAFLKAGRFEADRMFHQCQEQSTIVFDWDGEHTIWTLISIGMVHQNHQGWNSARYWFEAALNAAMSKYGEEDGIRIALEEAMKVGHFSYVSDEGRPFKTIFGVKGITIVPNRLHIE